MQTLGAIAEIQLGFTAKGRLEAVPEGGVPAIQLRDVSVDSPLAANISKYALDKVPRRYWARRGDLLFRSRGDRNTATALSDNFDEPAIAVMPLVIVRPDHERADSRYLAWYINQADAQRHFDMSARGTGIRMIPVGALSSLKVPLPDLATQRAIVEAAYLTQREFELSERLAKCQREARTIVSVLS